MKNILKGALTLELIFALTGCYPTGRRAANSDTNTENIMNRAEEIENFTLSLTLPEDHPLELPQITTEVRRWDEETINDILGVLGGGKPILSEKEYPSDAYPDETYRVWFFDAGNSFDAENSLDMENTMITFETERMSYEQPRIASLRYRLFEDMVDDVEPFVSYVSELDAFSKEDAIQRVKDVTEKLGITNLGEPTVVGQTSESVNNYFFECHKESEYFGWKPDNITWTKDDEAYYITFPLVYEGIPIETNRMYVPDYGYEPQSFVKACVTKNDIISLRCRGITSPDYKIGDAVKINFSAEDILEKIVSDYSQIILDDEVEFYNCELTYAPVEKIENNEWVLAPVWRFDYRVYRELYNEYYDAVFDELPVHAVHEYVVYNAETGNKIVNEN